MPTYEGEVLRFPDVVVKDTDENDAKRSTSGKGECIHGAFILYVHAQYVPDEAGKLVSC